MNTQANPLQFHNRYATIVRAIVFAGLSCSAQAGWQWSDQVDTLGPTGSESPFAFPQVGVDPISGIATAAWIDTTTFMNEKVQAVRFTNGQWGNPETISKKLEPVGPGNTGPTLIPIRGLAAQVAPGKNGDATVAWTSLLPDQYALSGTQWKKAKVRWSDPAFTPVENIGLGDPPQIRIGRDQNGITTAVWWGTAADGTHLIQTSRLKNGRWSQPKTHDQGANFSEPQLAVCKNGSSMIVWTTYGENWTRIDGSLFSAGKWKDVDIFFDFDMHSSPSITCSRPGLFNIVWRAYLTKNVKYPASFILTTNYLKGKGSKIWLVAEAEGDKLFNPKIASSPTGKDSTIVYEKKTLLEDGSVMNELMAIRKESDAWTNPVYIGLSGQHVSAPLVSLDGQGNTTVVWEYLTALTGQRHVKATRYSLGQWGSEVNQTTLCENCSSPSLAVDEQGKAWAVWVANGQVQSKRGGTLE